MQVFALAVEGGVCDAELADRVEERKFELFVIGTEIDEKVEYLAQHLGGTGVGTVYLVDDHDDRKSAFEGLVEHEAGLGQRALGRVDEEDDAVHHGKGALDFSAEIGMAWGVQDVDLDPVPYHRTVLGGNRDPALALEVHAVHEPFLGFLSLAEHAGLLEHGVDEGCFAMVNWVS